MLDARSLITTRLWYQSASPTPFKDRLEAADEIDRLTSELSCVKAELVQAKLLLEQIGQCRHCTYL